MRILITGALGHIGSQLIREIPSLLPDAEVQMLDNLSTQRYCSLFNLPAAGKYRFIEEDILTAELAPVFKGMDAIIHLAAITDAAGSFEIREKVEQVNFTGTQKVAEACIKAGCPMVFISTTSVYGTQKMIVDENCSAEDLRPQSPYAESKLRAEQMLQQLGAGKGLRFIICRFGTIFGVSPGMRFHTAVNKFVWQACLGKPITVWRMALNQKRPYLDLRDAVRAIGFITKNRRFDNGIYNVLTVNATVGEIVDIIKSVVGDLQIEYVDSPVMNQLSYAVSRKKFEALGFEFKGSLAGGIAETVRMLQGCRS